MASNEQQESSSVDNSLRGAAMRRASADHLPRTMTPYEWDQWYAENGVPPEHRNTAGWLERYTRLLARFLGSLNSKVFRR